MGFHKITLNEEIFNKTKPKPNQIFADNVSTYKRYVWDEGKGEFILPPGGDPPKVPWRIRKLKAEKYYSTLYKKAVEYGWERPAFKFKDLKTDEEIKKYYYGELNTAIEELETFLGDKGVTDIYDPEQLKQAEQDMSDFKDVGDELAAELEDDFVQKRMKTHPNYWSKNKDGSSIQADVTGNKIYESMQTFIAELCAPREEPFDMDTYSRLNRKQVPLMQQGIKTPLKGVYQQDVPDEESEDERITLAVFYDRSLSWSGFQKTLTARRIIDKLYEFTDATKYNPALEISEYGFSDDGLRSVSRFNPGKAGDAGIGPVGGTDNFAGTVVPYIKKYAPQNILVCTDSDPHTPLPEKLAVKYGAWYLYVGEKNDPTYNDLQNYIRGKKLTEAYYVPFDSKAAKKAEEKRNAMLAKRDKENTND